MLYKMDVYLISVWYIYLLGITSIASWLNFRLFWRCTNFSLL